MSSATSATGRLQFSVEKPKMVQPADAKVGRGLDDSPERLGASLVADGARQAPPFGPAPLPSMTIATCSRDGSPAPLSGAPADELWSLADMEAERVLTVYVGARAKRA